MHLSRLPYLDPGSGSFLLQLLIGALLAAGLAIRAFWTKIKRLFGGRSSALKNEDDANDVG